MTDKEVYEDYCKLCDRQPVQDSVVLEALINMVHIMREDEPRINCGAHLLDYMNICDEDDDMDSFYGPDYPW